MCQQDLEQVETVEGVSAGSFGKVTLLKFYDASMKLMDIILVRHFT